MTVDPNLVCSAPTSEGNEDLYCCFPGGEELPTCTPDDDLATLCSAPGTFGYQCQAGDDPTSFDSSLNCGAPVPDPNGVSDDYCCAVDGSSGSSSSSGSGGGPVGCAADPAIDCSGGGDGFACAAGDNPENENPSFSCSTPVGNGAVEDYCCFQGFPSSSVTCVPDDVLTSVCPDPDTYGYQCDSGDVPSSFDALLNCSTAVPDPDGVHVDYCCTYE